MIIRNKNMDHRSGHMASDQGVWIPLDRASVKPIATANRAITLAENAMGNREIAIMDPLIAISQKPSFQPSTVRIVTEDRSTKNFKRSGGGNTK